MSRSTAVLPEPAAKAAKPASSHAAAPAAAALEAEVEVTPVEEGETPGHFAFTSPHGASPSNPGANPHGNPGAGEPVVLDVDEARAFLTRWLLHELAPALGLDASKIQICVDAEAAARTSAAGADGLAQDGTIYLHPSRYQPQTQRGRHLLAHETAHVAQAANPRRSPIETEASRSVAELEAERVARAFTAREVLPVLSAFIGAEAPAADKDFDKRLAEAVSVGRERELDAIRRAISGLWISDGDVFDVFKIMEGMAFIVARAVIHALGRKGRRELCDNINTVHLQRNRTMVFACYDALEDNEFDVIDISVLADGPMGGLEGEEREAATRTIRNLKLDQVRDLLRSGNGYQINKLFLSSGARPLTDQEEKERVEKLQATLKDEQGLATQRQEVARLRKSEASKGIVEQIRAALNSKELSPPIGAQRSVDALSHFSGSQLQAIAELLDGEGLLDVIFAHLPEWAFFGANAKTETLLALMQSRLPFKNLDYVESLLSYGFFDWAVRDYEAKFAYLILKLLPLSAQYRFRQRDNGKWFMRLVQNLPDDFKKTDAYKGDIEVRKASKDEIEKLKAEGFSSGRNEIDEKDLYYDVTERHRRRLAQGGLLTKVEILRSDFREAAKADDKVAAYKALHARIAATGSAGFAEGKFMAADQLELEALVHELDRDGYIEKLFSELPEEFLYSETTRIATVRIMMARDPARAQYHARELVSRGFTDWMVTDREAYLAYLCVKALPDEERKAFIENDSDAWGEILSEMSKDARNSPDLNVYVGDKEGTDRASVLGQLADKSTWTGKNALRLDGLIRMAIAMTEHKFAFDRSKEFKANEDADLLKLVDKYFLYNPHATPPRKDYTPGILKGTKWYEEGLFATLRTIWAGLVFLFDNDILLLSRSIGSKDLNLNELQDVMGGDIKGVRLADQDKEFGNNAPNPDSNKLTLWIDVGAHAVTLSLPDLRIDAVSMQAAGQTIQTGSIHLTGLQIDCSYDTDDLKQPTHAEITAGSVDMRDMLISFRNSMVTLSRFFLSALRLAAGVSDTKTPGGATPREGYYLPIPLLGQIAGLVYYIFKFKGWGPDTPETEIGRGIGELRAMDITFADLQVDGLQTSGGQNVGKLKITDFALRVGLNKTTALRAQIDSLEQRSKRLHARGEDDKARALDEQRDKAEKELAKLAADEKRMLEIQQILLHGDPSGDERIALQKEIDKIALEAKGGVYVDIGSIEASGISGTVTSKEPIKVDDIHGEAASPALAAGLGLQLLTPERLQQLAKGGKPKTLAELGGTLNLEFSKFHTGELSIGGGIRTAKEIEARVKELEPKKDSYEFGPLYEHLVSLQAAAVKYEQYVAVGVSMLNDTQLEEFRKLRELLTREPDIIFGSIDLIEARLTVDPSGELGIGAKEATLKNIRLPERGLSVDEVKALDIHAGAGVRGGLTGWLDAKKNIDRGHLTAQSITVTGARSDFHGLLVDRLELTGREKDEKLELDIKDRGNTVRVGVSIHATGLGIAPRIGMMKRHVDGLKRRQSTTPDPKTEAEIESIEKNIADLEALVQKRAQAWAALARAKTPEEKEIANQAVFEADGIITDKLAQVSAASLDLEGFGLEVKGAGDVLSMLLSDDGFDPVGLLDSKTPGAKKEISIAGTGPDHRLFKRFAVEGVQGTQDQGLRGTTAQGQKAEIGETRLNMTLRKEGDAIWVDVGEFNMASLTLTRFDLTSLDGAAGTQIWSDGTSGFEGAHLKGRVRLTSKVKGSRDLSDFVLDHAEIDDFRIERIYAEGLGYKSIGEKLEVQISSGSIKGVYAKDLKVDLPSDGKPPVILGKVGVESIDHLTLGKSIFGAYEVGGGVINAKNFSVEALEDGSVKSTLENLSLSAIALRGPDGWARFSLADIGWKAEYKDGVLDLKDFHLGSLRVAGIDWRFGKKHIKVSSPATIVNVKASAKVETDLANRKPDPNAEKPKGFVFEKPKSIQRITVSKLDVESISADDILYEDGDMEIRIRKPDPSFPAAMKKFVPLYIGGIHANDIEWTKDDGLVSASGRIEEYSAVGTFKDLKKGLEAGLAISGAGLTAKISSDGTTTFDPGTVDETAGFFKGMGFDAQFTTGGIFGSLTLGPDFLQLDGFKVKDIDLPKAEYHAPGRDLTLGSPHIDEIRIPYVKATFDKFEVNGEKAALLRDVTVPEVTVLGVKANSIDYKGEAEGLDDKGNKVKTNQDIHGGSTFLDRLYVSGIFHDAVAETTKLTIKADNRDSSKPAFGVSGLTANIVKTVGSVKTTKKIAGDLQGKRFTGDNITIGSVTLGKVRNKDGGYDPVKRTTVEGHFQLTDLGWLNPDLSLTDEKGGRLTLGKGVGSSPRVTIGNIEVQALPNGTLRAEADDIKVRDLLLKRYKPGASVADIEVEIPTVDLQRFAVSLKGLGTEEGLKLLALKAHNLTTKDLEIRITKHKKQLSQDEVNEAKKDPSAPIYLEPLGGMKGMVEAGVAGTGGVVMKDIYIARGVAFTMVPMPPNWTPVPVSLADVREEAEGFLNAPPDTKPPKDLRFLDNVEAKSSGLKLGDGRVAIDLNHSGTIDKEDVIINVERFYQNENVIILPSSVIGKEIIAKVPNLRFRSIEIPDLISDDPADKKAQKLAGKTGLVHADVEVIIRGLSTATIQMIIKVKDGKIDDVELGDLNMLNLGDLGKVDPPTLKQVNKKGEEGEP